MYNRKANEKIEDNPPKVEKTKEEKGKQISYEKTPNVKYKEDSTFKSHIFNAAVA